MSQGVTIDTPSFPCRIAYATNVTGGSITEPVPTTTKPVEGANGVFPMGDDGGISASSFKLVFYGVGSNGNTFTANVYGWEEQQSINPNVITPLWVPVTLATFTTITLNSSITGVSGTDIDSTNLFASAITLGGVANSGISVEVCSPGAATAEIAHVVLDTKGCRFLEVRMAKGTATSVNCLGRKM